MSSPSVDPMSAAAVAAAGWASSPAVLDRYHQALLSRRDVLVSTVSVTRALLGGGLTAESVRSVLADRRRVCVDGVTAEDLVGEGWSDHLRHVQVVASRVHRCGQGDLLLEFEVPSPALSWPNRPFRDAVVDFVACADRVPRQWEHDDGRRRLVHDLSRAPDRIHPDTLRWALDEGLFSGEHNPI